MSLEQSVDKNVGSKVRYEVEIIQSNLVWIAFELQKENTSDFEWHSFSGKVLKDATAVDETNSCKENFLFFCHNCRQMHQT